MKRKKRKVYESWPCVFEVSDAAGPRRFPDKPRVCVKPKCSKPGRALERWFSVSEKVEKKKLVSIRYDLMPGENNKGGSNNPFYLPKEKAEGKECSRRRREKANKGGDSRTSAERSA